MITQVEETIVSYIYVSVWVCVDVMSPKFLLNMHIMTAIQHVYHTHLHFWLC